MEYPKNMNSHWYRSTKPKTCKCTRPAVRISRGDWVCAHCLSIEQEMDRRYAIADRAHKQTLIDDKREREKLRSQRRSKELRNVILPLQPGPCGLLIEGAYTNYPL